MSELQGVSADLWKHIHDQERINQAMQRDIQMLAAQVQQLQEHDIKGLRAQVKQLQEIVARIS